jgi:hypothetical protein
MLVVSVLCRWIGLARLWLERNDLLFDRDVGYILDSYIPQCDDIISTLGSLRSFTIHIASLWLFDLA